MENAVTLEYNDQERFQGILDQCISEGFIVVAASCPSNGNDCWRAILSKESKDPLIAPTKFLTGLDAIIAERRRQYDKGRTIQYDLKTNINGELQRAAEALLTHNESKWPAGWNFTYYKKWITYPLDRQLAIVAALLSAEIDRISPPTTA